MARFSWMLGLTMALAATGAASADCLDATSGDPFGVHGTLSHDIFPGPPGFADVKQGDTPEPAYILEVPVPFCVTGDDFIDPSDEVATVHLIAGEGMAPAMRKLIGKRVSTVLQDPFGAHTGHHHAPLVATVVSIAPADDDPTGEYGTAATVVRGFYLALGAGNGEAAADFIVPEKRTQGPLSAAALTAFYSKLTEPLELASVEPIAADRYLARYSFRHGSRSCNGRAEVTTVNRHGENLIQRIKALDGC